MEGPLNMLLYTFNAALGVSLVYILLLRERVHHLVSETMHLRIETESVVQPVFTFGGRTVAAHAPNSQTLKLDSSCIMVVNLSHSTQKGAKECSFGYRLPIDQCCCVAHGRRVLAVPCPFLRLRRGV